MVDYPGIMAAAGTTIAADTGLVWLTAPIDVTPASSGSWQDIDVSTLVPSGTVGVLVRFSSTLLAFRAFGLRKNGSTDNRISDSYGAYFMGFVGVDGSRIFEAYMEDIASTALHVLGYCLDGTFQTNATNVTPGTTGSFQDVDISSITGAETAIAAIVELNNTSFDQIGLRRNGSADSVLGYTPHTWAIVPLDGSEIFEAHLSGTSSSVFLVGWLTNASNYTFDNNKVNVTPASTGWQNMAALPAGATGGFFEIAGGGTSDTWGLREDGSAETLIGSSRLHRWGASKADASRIIEVNRSVSGLTVYRVGYTL